MKDQFKEHILSIFENGVEGRLVDFMWLTDLPSTHIK